MKRLKDRWYQWQCGQVSPAFEQFLFWGFIFLVVWVAGELWLP